MRTIVMCFLFLTINSIGVAEVRAEKKTDKNKVDLVQQLNSDRPEEVAAAIESVKTSKSRTAVTALIDRIRRGLPPALLSAAVESLARNGSKPALKELVALANHRSYAVRKSIASHLAQSKSRQALKVLTSLLDDPKAEVRSAAAKALGELGPKPAMKELQLAAERGVPEAAQIVGKEMRPAEVKKLIKGATENNMEALMPVFQELAQRKDIPENVKLAIVELLAKTDSIGSKRLLAYLAVNLPKWDPVRLAAVGASGDTEPTDEGGESNGAN